MYQTDASFALVGPWHYQWTFYPFSGTPTVVGGDSAQCTIYAVDCPMRGYYEVKAANACDHYGINYGQIYKDGCQ
jgi:hypothetical protein